MGVAGEIYIGGAGVARGYLNREELTAERFVEDPFAGEVDARMYKTGDLGRWPTGRQAGVPGPQRPPGEGARASGSSSGRSRARLASAGGVSEVVVLAREDEPGTSGWSRTTRVRRSCGAEALREHARGELPEYMVPSAYVRLESMPLTPNGKLDRKALPAPDGEAYVTRAYEAPRGQVEEALAEIWSRGA